MDKNVNENVEGAIENGVDAENVMDEGTEIRDTDIVFDCPHCGHNLAIDYRGAGLQINCVKCGESVLVPIPDGMKIDDLDIEPGEILKQLFATRRHNQANELRIDELQKEIGQMKAEREKLDEKLSYLRAQLAAIRLSFDEQTDLQKKTTAHLDRMTKDLEAAVQ